MTSYEIWRGKKLNLKHLHEFGSTCFVLNDREHMRKFDQKSDESVPRILPKQQSLHGNQQVLKNSYGIS